MPADFDDILRKLELNLRTNISDPNSRLNSRTENFSGDNLTVEFELQDDEINIPGGGRKHLVMHIDSITVDGTPLSFITDYDYQVNGTDAGKITFVTAPSSGTNNIIVIYSMGDSSWIYDEFPKIDTPLTAFPRVAITQVGGSTEIDGIGGEEFVSNLTMSITIFAPKKTEVREIGNAIRDYIVNNAKAIITPDFLAPAGMSRMLLDPNRGYKIFQKTWDYRVPNICDLKV